MRFANLLVDFLLDRLLLPGAGAAARSATTTYEYRCSDIRGCMFSPFMRPRYFRSCEDGVCGPWRMSGCCQP